MVPFAAIRPVNFSTRDVYKRQSLLYTILPIQEAVAYYNDCQMSNLRREYALVSAEKRLEEYDRKHGR